MPAYRPLHTPVEAEMHKKSPTPKKAPTTRRTSTPSEQIDHRALALLEYIDAGRTGIDAMRQARVILRGVTAALTSTDPNDGADIDIMHGSRNGPGIFSAVFDGQLKDYQRGGTRDWKSHVRFMTEMEGDKVDALSATDPQVAYDVFVACVGDAALLGAAIMYELMTERER
jgi:hypothetical protein